MLYCTDYHDVKQRWLGLVVLFQASLRNKIHMGLYVAPVTLSEIIVE